MAFVQIDENGAVFGIFACRQNDPAPPGYAEVDDKDQRITDFLSAVNQRQIIAKRKNDAITALRESNDLVLASYEQGQPIPAALANYRKKLRDISVGGGEEVPPRPTLEF